MQLLLEIDKDIPVTPENLWKAFQKNPKPLPEHDGRLLILDEKRVKANSIRLDCSCQEWISEVGISNSVVTIIPAPKEPTRTMLDCYKCKNNKADVNCEECHFEPTEDLKPCPFCGGKAAYSEFDYRGERECAIVCSNSDCRCSAIHTFHIWRDRPSAVKAWNTRVKEGD